MEERKTEGRNPATSNIDTLPTIEMMWVINREDHKVAAAVESQIPEIAKTVDEVYKRLKAGGRLFYCGAGTSGRIGILDASECVPTYNVPPTLVQGLIAGGSKAVFKAVEGAEDDVEACEKELKERRFTKRDVLVGIAASGTTPYVLGGLKYARSIGALTVGIACNENPPLARFCQINIIPVVGPEVITGSTRMKAGTAQKLVLNMISTGVMIRLGKVYGNLMVDLQISNAKLADRACRIVEEVANVDYNTASKALEICNGELKTAIVYLCTKLDTNDARHRLEDCGGSRRNTGSRTGGGSPKTAKRAVWMQGKSL